MAADLYYPNPLCGFLHWPATRTCPVGQLFELPLLKDGGVGLGLGLGRDLYKDQISDL